MRFLITGSAGQLAREFVLRFERDGVEYLAPPESDLDITDVDSVRECIGACRPDVVLNCAAYNNVDAAETDVAAAMKVNSEAVGNLARSCRETNALLVHYSTDYVFDGRKEGLNTESDGTGPVNRYGESKLAGEQAVAWGKESNVQQPTSNNQRPTLESGATRPDFLLFRTSWLYGGKGSNLLTRMLDWSRDRDVIRVVWDQVSVPTYTVDVVDVSLRAVESGMRGLYHLTNTGYASKYEVARFLFAKLGLNKLVLPVSSDAFPGAAPRPFFSAMSSEKVAGELGITLPAWEEGIERYVGGGAGVGE